MALDTIQPNRINKSGTWSFTDATSKLLVGADANFTDFANAKAVISNGDTGITSITDFGIVGEAIPSVSNAGCGVGGYSKTNGAKIGIGIFGASTVTNTADTATAYAVYGLSEATHSGGANYGVYGGGSGGTNNRGVYGYATANGANPSYGVFGIGSVAATGDTATAYGIYAQSNTTHAGGDNIAFYTTAANGATNYSFYGASGTLYNAGNVGIGTTAPVTKLQVGNYADGSGEPTYVGSVRLAENLTSVEEVGGIEFKLTTDNYGAKIQALSAGGANIVFAVRQNSATWAENFRFSPAANFSIGGATFGANSIAVMAIPNGTAPAAHVDNEIQIYSVDTADNTATLGLMLEQAVEDIGTFTPSHKIKVLINGTAYWIQLDAV